MIHTSNSVQRMAVAAHPRVVNRDLRIVEICLKDRDGIDYKRWVSYCEDPFLDYTDQRKDAAPFDSLMANRIMVRVYDNYRHVFPGYRHVRVQILPAKEDA